MEAESKTWVMTCPSCGVEQSVWDAGGIRYRARSAAKRSLARCTTCGRRFFARIERRVDGSGQTP
jgi:transcription elongation factor Elf1